MFKILVVEDGSGLKQLFQQVLIKNGDMVKGVLNGDVPLQNI